MARVAAALHSVAAAHSASILRFLGGMPLLSSLDAGPDSDPDMLLARAPPPAASSAAPTPPAATPPGAPSALCCCCCCCCCCAIADCSPLASAPWAMAPAGAASPRPPLPPPPSAFTTSRSPPAGSGFDGGVAPARRHTSWTWFSRQPRLPAREVDIGQPGAGEELTTPHDTMLCLQEGHVHAALIFKRRHRDKKQDVTHTRTHTHAHTHTHTHSNNPLLATPHQLDDIHACQVQTLAWPGPSTACFCKLPL